MLYRQAKFLKGSSKPVHFPEDLGDEVAFAGRSNAGKSSALNVLTGQTGLARVSKAPGRTREINFFTLTENARLVDLPGYGYAKVSKSMQEDWTKTIDTYLRERKALRGMVLLMDCRRPLMDSDREVVQWCAQTGMPCHILLTKSDKMSRGKGMGIKQKVFEELKKLRGDFSVQLFSSLKKSGVEELEERLDTWFESEILS